MSQLPAYCPECHTLSPAPLAADGPTDVTFFDIPVRCARCESSGHIPANVREWVGQAALAARAVDPNYRAPIRDALDRCREEGVSASDCRGRLREMDVPTRDLADIFHRLEVQELDFAPLVAAAAVAALDLVQDAPEEVASLGREELVNWTVDRVLDRFAVEPPPDRGPSEEERRLAETGRNQTCPCGSGEKYKDCHWIEDQQATRS